MAKNTSANSKATVQYEKLVDLDNTPPQNHADSAQVESGFEALDPVATKIAFDQEQRITRKSGDSVAETTKEKQFSQTRLDQLFDKWDNGAEAFWTSYQERCEIVYEIQKETAKPGCKGAFSAALRRIRLSDSTAYDMIKRHRIRIGEIPDPDMPDLRDEVEENSRTAAGAGAEEWDDLSDPELTQNPGPRAVQVLKDKIGPFQQKKAKSQRKPLRLDSRAQATIVKAQLAVNDVVAALKNGGDWQSALVEYDKVAVAPAKLDSFLSALAPEPDWKALLIELIAVLEQHGDRLPLPVLNKKHVIETMLGGGDYKNSASATDSARNANAYKVEKRGEGKETEYAVIHTATKKVRETFKSETEAESVAVSLNSPVVSLTNIDAPPKHAPRSAGLECTGCEALHRGIASKAEAHPEWTDSQLAEACGCSLTIVRQAKTRFLTWRQEGAA